MRSSVLQRASLSKAAARICWDVRESLDSAGAKLLHVRPQEKRAVVTTGLSSQEVGDVLGKSAGAVRVQLHRTIRQLRDRYQKITGGRRNE